MQIVVKGMFLMDLGEKIFNELCSFRRVPTEMQQVYWGEVFLFENVLYSKGCTRSDWNSLFPCDYS